MTRVELLPRCASGDRALVDEVVAVVNDAYVVAEEGLWRPGLTRTDPRQTAEAIERHEVAVAWLDDEVVGSVSSRLLDEQTGWFGALAARVDRGGRGIGRRLVTFAEDRMRAAGATTMQLELIVPSIPHPHTDRLARWYRSLGYRDIEHRTLAELDPPAVEYLLAPCTVAVMHKSLAADRS